MGTFAVVSCRCAPLRRHTREGERCTHESRLSEPVDDAIRVTREQVVPVVLGLPGSRGGFFLVNRDEAKTLSLTLWESREALDASAAPIERLRGERTRDVPGSELLELEEYEIVLAPPWAQGPSG
jgi:hypothetical protein